jgi:hypothetical protein
MILKSGINIDKLEITLIMKLKKLNKLIIRIILNRIKAT